LSTAAARQMGRSVLVPFGLESREPALSGCAGGVSRV